MKRVTHHTFWLITLLVFIHTVSISQVSKSDSLHHVLSQTNNELIKSECYLKLAKDAYQSNLDTAIFYAQKSLSIAEMKKNNPLIISANLFISLIYYQQSSLKESFQILNDLSLIPKDQWSDRQLQIYYIYLGLVNNARGATQEAIQNYLRGLEISKRNKDTANIGMFLNNLSQVYFESDTVPLAIKSQKQAIQYFEFTNNQNYLTNGYVNLGNYYMGLNQLDSSKYYLKIALNRLEAFQNKYGLVKCYASFGDVYLKEGKEDSAFYYLQKSLATIESSVGSDILTPTETKIEILLSIVDVYLLTNKFDSALAYSIKANRLALSTNNVQILVGVTYKAYEVYQKLNVYDSALYYFEKYHSYSTVLIEEKNAKTVANLLLTHELEASKAKHEEELELEKRHRITSYWIFSFFTLFLIGALGLVYQRFRHNRLILEKYTLEKVTIKIKNEKLNLELDNKNRELATKMMYLIKKNEFILSISSRLKEINLRSSKKVESELLPILKDLEKMSEDELWEEFELHFQEVHQSFYDELTNKFPNLTANDLKMCAFIKLNLSIKEVASITYQTPESIKTARYRLRKKLGIERETNLVAFLNTF